MSTPTAWSQISRIPAVLEEVDRARGGGRLRRDAPPQIEARSRRVGEYAPGGVGEGEEKGQRARGDEALEDGALEDGAYEQGVFTGDRGQGRGSSRTGGVTFDALEPFDRLALRRTELLRQFARHGGTNVRVLERVDESTTDEIVLLADTDPVAGSAAIPVLEEIACRLLRTRATVVSMTALRMFGSGRL